MNQPGTTAVPIASSAPGSRSRQQARRKPNDDAGYFGPTSAIVGQKRPGGDRLDGEPRVKRKRVDGSGMVSGVSRRPEREEGMEMRGSLVKFTKMPLGMLYRYLSHYDLVPPVYPSPLTADDPPPPSSLENGDRDTRNKSPTPKLPSTGTTTPANRPRRESKDQNRRRSSRFAEEEARGRTPVLADVDEVHRILAGIAERHFREEGRREEVDVLASFMCKVKGTPLP